MIDAEQFLISLCKHKDANGKLKPIYLADTIKEEIQIIEEAVKYSQRWVGLTDEEIGVPTEPIQPDEAIMFARVIEALIKGKNNVLR